MCRRAKVLSVPLACAVIMAAGCYRYAPIPFDAVTPGMEIRATLTGNKARELEPLLGAPQPRLQGEVLHRSGETLLLGVPQFQASHQGISGDRLRQWHWFEDADLLHIDIRFVDRRRTGALVGLTGAVVGYALYRVLGGGAVDTDDSSGPINGEITPFRVMVRPYPRH